MPPEAPLGVPQEHHTEYWAHLGAIILYEMTGLKKNDMICTHSQLSVKLLH